MAIYFKKKTWLLLEKLRKDDIIGIVGFIAREFYMQRGNFNNELYRADGLGHSGGGCCDPV